MPSRTESIFNIGDEKTTETNNKGTSVIRACSRGEPESLVGLRILIEEERRASKNIVINIGFGNKSSGFLKACFFCRKELSLEKEVYMYRGDQGFCSVECRYQRILLDDRREFEASKRKWRKMQQYHQNAMPKLRAADARRRVTIGA